MEEAREIEKLSQDEDQNERKKKEYQKVKDKSVHLCR